MRHFDLFSGIGGFALGLQWTGGFETVGFCERDKFCKNALNKDWPKVPVFNDITELQGDECGTIDILTGGFPCQPFSVAGKRLGAEDDRALWPEMLRVIKTARPRWVIGENVAGIINMELEQCLLDLEAVGYEVWPVVIPACAVDAHHRRDRVWIIAHTTGSNDGESSAKSMQRQKQELGNGNSATVLANTNSNSLQREQSEDTNAQERTQQGERQARPCFDGSRRQWAPEPAVGRVADGISDRAHRIKALGNAIVPQIAEILGGYILKIEGVIV